MTSWTSANRTASEQIADFITEFDAAQVSAAAAVIVRRALYDTLAVAIAARREAASRLILQTYAGHSGPLLASIWATGQRLPVELAALINGTMAHVLDYDDLAVTLRGHPSAAMFPALVALAEAHGNDSDELVTAYVVGFEVMSRISRVIAADHYAQGWHSTASIGMLGTTAACARLLRLDRRQTVHALGLCVAQAAGTRQNFGSMTKSFQAGHANAAAVRSTLLAAGGFESSAQAIDGDVGYLALYAARQRVGAELDRLGEAPLEIESCGLEVKKYPMCYATHRALDGILDIRSERLLTLAAVEAVEVVANHRALAPLIYTRPRNGLEAKFSMQYAVATALADGRVNLQSFSDAAILRAEIQELLPRVIAREVASAVYPRWTELTLRLRDGTSIRRRIEVLRGSAELPLSEGELIVKARDCFAFAGAQVFPEALAALVFDTTPAPMSALFAALAPTWSAPDIGAA